LQDLHLHNCPFCRSTLVSIFECDVGSWAVSCHDCKAIGPLTTTPEDAVLRWNRAAPAASDDDQRTPRK
jgi:hypothetical protein